jgi:basic membrane lipoprotein Med (substrate-binding protein (PBP1-ABC) superfamily)
VIKQGSSVMMQTWSEYSGLFIELARRLKREHSCQIHLYVGIDRDVAYYSSVDNGQLFSSVNHASELMVHCFEPLPPRSEIVSEEREMA